jgi:hypothetical protein
MESDGVGWREMWAYHAQTHALVRVDEVGEDLGGGSDGDAALVAQLVQTALHTEVGKPVLAVLGWVSDGVV